MSNIIFESVYLANELLSYLLTFTYLLTYIHTYLLIYKLLCTYWDLIFCGFNGTGVFHHCFSPSNLLRQMNFENLSLRTEIVSFCSHFPGPDKGTFLEKQV